MSRCPICRRSDAHCSHVLDLQERRANEAVAGGYRHWRYDRSQIEAPWEADPTVRMWWETDNRRKASQ